MGFRPLKFDTKRFLLIILSSLSIYILIYAYFMVSPLHFSRRQSDARKNMYDYGGFHRFNKGRNRHKHNTPHRLAKELPTTVCVHFICAYLYFLQMVLLKMRTIVLWRSKLYLPKHTRLVAPLYKIYSSDLAKSITSRSHFLSKIHGCSTWKDLFR